jgi:hypothetical protein
MAGEAKFSAIDEVVSRRTFNITLLVIKLLGRSNRSQVTQRLDRDSEFKAR